MLPHKRLPRLAVSALIVASLSAFVVSRAREGTARFVPRALPQRALGDFDGDGRADFALIQGHAGDRHVISVELSGSRSAIQLDADVSALVENDIDHDGDLDLVAARPDGEVLIWLNDGHGRFTRQAALPASGLSGEPTVAPTAWPQSDAITVVSSVLPPLIRREHAVVGTRIRPPSGPAPDSAASPALPALRAPPPARA
jgi:hypothetical protein